MWKNVFVSTKLANYADTMSPTVITIANQKGSTGKTTLTALLACSLANRGYNVLMLDLDPQAHLSSLFLKISEVKEVEDGTFDMAMSRGVLLIERP